MNTTTISPLEAFRKAFPWTIVIAYDDELKYRFTKKWFGRMMEQKAQEVIILNGLKVTAVLEVWESGGCVHEVCLVVKPVPEEYLVTQ